MTFLTTLVSSLDHPDVHVDFNRDYTLNDETLGLFVSAILCLQTAVEKPTLFYQAKDLNLKNRFEGSDAEIR
jgi:hypothetical protein